MTFFGLEKIWTGHRVEIHPDPVAIGGKDGLSDELVERMLRELASTAEGQARIRRWLERGRDGR